MPVKASDSGNSLYTSNMSLNLFVLDQKDSVPEILCLTLPTNMFHCHGTGTLLHRTWLPGDQGGCRQRLRSDHQACSRPVSQGSSWWDCTRQGVHCKSPAGQSLAEAEPRWWSRTKASPLSWTLSPSLWPWPTASQMGWLTLIVWRSPPTQRSQTSPYSCW